MRAAGPFLYSFIALFEAGTNPLLDNKHYTTNHKFRVDAGLKSVWRRDHIFNFLTRYKRAGNRNSAGISGRRCARRRAAGRGSEVIRQVVERSHGGNRVEKRRFEDGDGGLSRVQV